MYQFLNKGLIVAKMWKVAICRARASGQVGQTIAWPIIQDYWKFVLHVIFYIEHKQ